MPDFTFSISAPTPTAPSNAATTTPFARALQIDPATGDLVHDGKRLQLTYGLNSIAQALRTKLAFFQGEWFLDETHGTPYFSTILGKQAPLAAVREAFREVIAGTLGVLEVTKLELTPGTRAREYVLTFTCSTDLGLLTLTVNTEVP